MPEEAYVVIQHGVVVAKKIVYVTRLEAVPLGRAANPFLVVEAAQIGHSDRL